MTLFFQVLTPNVPPETFTLTLAPTVLNGYCLGCTGDVIFLSLETSLGVLHHVVLPTVSRLLLHFSHSGSSAGPVPSHLVLFDDILSCSIFVCPLPSHYTPFDLNAGCIT